MERKIGEKFTANGKTYIVEASNHVCKGCVCKNVPYSECVEFVRRFSGDCSSGCRKDNRDVIFKKVEEDFIISENNNDFDKENMKPFNLEEAKAGKPVCTRDGREARILCFDLNKKNYPIAAAITLEEGNESVEVFTIDGKYDPDIYDKDLDLMMVTEKKKGWIGLYRSTLNDTLAHATDVYATKEEVEADINNVYQTGEIIEIRQIEWEE